MPLRPINLYMPIVGARYSYMTISFWAFKSLKNIIERSSMWSIAFFFILLLPLLSKGTHADIGDYGVLQVIPSDSIIASGQKGGPFTPDSLTYTLSNTGGAAINWTAANTQTWISLSLASGTLQPGARVSVTVSINRNANNLAASQTIYTDKVSFTNTTNGNGNASRAVSLRITGSSSNNMAPIISSLSNDYLFVSDYGAKVVHKLSINGIYKKKIGEGLLENAFSCLIDSKKNLLVGDGSDFKVFSNDNFVGTFGSGYFGNNGAVLATVDACGNIYAANNRGGTIEVFNKEYRHTNRIDVRNWLGEGVGGGEEGPTGITYDSSDGSLIFTTIEAISGDTGSYKITRSGSLIRKFGPTGNSQYDCKIGNNGTIYIKDTTANTAAVTLFNSDGNFIKNWVPIGNNPYGLAFDSKERIYVVVDPKRVEVYEGTNSSTPIRTITSSNFQTCGGMDIGRRKVAAALPQLSTGESFTAGLKTNATVVAIGDNNDGQLNVGSWTNIIQLAAGSFHTAGLKADSTVVATGDNYDGQLNVGSWTNIIQLAAGGDHTVGLNANGTVVATGYNAYGQLNVGSWTNIIQLAAGSFHTVGLKADGTVVATGYNAYGQLNVGSWTNIIQLAAGGDHTLGLKADGTVVATGDNAHGQLNVGSWTNIIQLAAGGDHTLGLKADGTVVATGDNAHGQLNVGAWTPIIQLATNRTHTVGLKADGTVVATGANDLGQCNVSGWNLRSILSSQ